MRNAIIFLDSGDTLVDESTEVRIKGDVVDHAEFFTGIKEVLFQLKNAGFRVALVADGLVESFDNIYRQHEMETYFEVRAISETVGVCKPAGEMFKTAMEKMNLEEADKKYIIMIGNNLERDIVGANRMGITSVLAGYSPRYRMKPENEEETPDYVVCDPSEIPALIEILDKQMENKKQLGW